jgi:hypothetical protein
MKSIIKIFFLIPLVVFSLNAKENFSEMSTQELIAIMGYVKPSESEKFQKELKSRVETMSPSEKEKYERNVKKLK